MCFCYLDHNRSPRRVVKTHSAMAIGSEVLRSGAADANIHRGALHGQPDFINQQDRTLKAGANLHPGRRRLVAVAAVGWGRLLGSALAHALYSARVTDNAIQI